MTRSADITSCVARRLCRRRRGSITIEAVLVLPVILVLYGAVAQVMLLSQARSYVEHAAYAAARSALVYKCQSVPPLSAPLYAAYEAANCKDQPQKWEDAARWALVPASAMNQAYVGNCNRAGEQALKANPGYNNADAALNAAICYAFEDGNVDVDVEWVTSGISGANPFANKPIRATVSFSAPLSTPFRRFIDDGKNGKGIYYRNITASVVLM